MLLDIQTASTKEQQHNISSDISYESLEDIDENVAHSATVPST
jgi:hypothetical protein